MSLQVAKFLPLDFGSAILGGFFQVMFDRIMPRTLPHIIVREQELVSELKKWSINLSMIQSVIHDAEEKQWRNMAVRVWLKDLGDFAYDLEDMLDEYATRILERQSATSGDITSITIEELKNLFRNFRNMSDCGLMSDRLKELCERINLLELMERTVRGRTDSTVVCGRLASTCVQSKSVIYGREEDKKRIFGMMSTAIADIRVISIVGMAGVGKTTVAQSVYNDSGSVAEFYPKVWVSISHEFDVFRISMAILESCTHTSHDLKSLNEVQLQLQTMFSGKMFLLVLDDVWSRNYDLWETLRSPFFSGAPGSVVIVTTRSMDVALTVGGKNNCYDLKLLSDHDCWSVFKMHAFDGIRGDDFPNMNVIRDKVVANSGGLPLAARTLGGLLRSKGRYEEWKDILDSKIWNLPEESNILPVLKLSYYHLPVHLKRCLAYCAIFLQNYEFDEKELVLLWMAEGLILPSANRLLEDIGSEYFQELVSRSIFQHASGNPSKFVMHNLINDLAEWISGETVLKMEDGWEAKTAQPIRFLKARHCSYIGDDFDGKSKVEVLRKIENLRTFLPVTRKNRDCFMTDTDLIDLLSRFKKLRVLSLRRYNIEDLPNEAIESLRYLRYLNLSDTKIRSLPQSLEKLYNLQVLLLKNCSVLKMLPDFIVNMISLLHLDISGASAILGMPNGMENLEYLQTLSDFIVSSTSTLIALKKMKSLGGELRISSLQNVLSSNSFNFELGILSDKKNLRVLILEWNSDAGRNDLKEKQLLDMLQPHKNLRTLTIENYNGVDFPYWIGERSFVNIVDLTFRGCKRCTTLPPVGLLCSLEHLTIIDMTQLNTVGSSFYGEGCLKPFPSLETLHLEKLEAWTTWETINTDTDVNVFTCLRELSIINCPRLTGTLPQQLPALQKLVVRQCAALVVSFTLFPELCQLEIDQINGVNRSSTNANATNSTPLANNLDSQSSQTIWEVEQLRVKNFSLASTIMNLFSISGLTSLEIVACGGLTSLQSVMEQSKCLDRLKVEGCDSLELIHRGQLPASLKWLEIDNCNNMHCILEPLATEAAGSENTKLSALERLYISNCASMKTIVSISRGQLSDKLKWLEIKQCGELNSFLPSGELPVSLECLKIHHCGIHSIPIGRHNVDCLHEVEIFECHNVKGFPQDGIQLTSLRRLSVRFCRMLADLPSSIQGFNSLQELQVFQCPRINPFQQTGLPASLTSLTIEGDKLYKWLAEWGFHRLTCLRKLDIIGGSTDVKFPREGMKLPASLNYLCLADFFGLRFLDKEGFLHLTSLEYFTLSGFRNPLKNFPEVLPSSLVKLELFKCSDRFKNQVRTMGGRRRENIAHIPFVKIDSQFTD